MSSCASERSLFSGRLGLGGGRSHPPPHRWTRSMYLTALLSKVRAGIHLPSPSLIKDVLEKVRSAALLASLGLLRAQMSISGDRLRFLLLSSEWALHCTGEGTPSRNNRLCFQNLALSLSKSSLPLPAQTRTGALIYLRCDFPTHHLHSLLAHLVLPTLKENQNRTF